MTQRGQSGWQIDKAVLECNKYMFENSVSCDVVFRVCSPGGVSDNISAHKYVLISRSPVFEALFCGDFVTTENSENAIEIPDIEPDAFRELLRYIYYENVSLCPDNVLPVLYAAKKYLLHALAKTCMEFLEREISVENVCTILNHSILYEEKELTDKCLTYIAPRTKQVIINDCFLSLTSQAISKLLSCDQLFVSSEVVILNACIRWAAAQSNRQNTFITDKELRSLLGDNLRRIRFASMSAKDFALAVGQNDMLSNEEKSRFYYYLLTNSGKEGLLELGFDVTYRVQKCVRYPCLGKTAGWWTCNGPGDAVSFTLDKPITFVGAAVYGGREPSTHHVTMELWRSPDVLLQKTDQKIDSDGSSVPIPIYFESSNLVLCAEEQYTVVMVMKGPIAYYGQGGTDSITVASSNITFQFNRSEKSGNGTNIKSGQIPELLFLPKGE